MLWAVEALTEPIAVRLRFHFASSSGSMNQPEHPEWLFQTALRYARGLAPALEGLQEIVTAHGLQETYHLPFELARALRSSVQEVLRSSWLPRLASLADPNLWMHFAEQAVKFEHDLAPLRGLPLPPDSREGEAAQVWAPGGCVEVICEEQDWSRGWMGAEAAEALSQVEAAVDSSSAWLPAEQAWDPAASTSAAWDDTKQEEAWESEFWPPCCAEAVLQLLRQLAHKACWLPEGEERRQFAASVPLEASKAFRAKMQAIGRTADEFGDLAGPVWAPRVSACICAARHMVQSLREPSPLLLALDEEMPLPNGKRRGRSLLDGEAAAYESASRRWSLRMAKAIAEKFADESARYRRRPHLEAFSASDPRVGGVSKELVRALEWLAGCLDLLSQHLDAVAFREVWRCAAIALNRLMYNDVATEARFSHEGAEQFAADCQALQEGFRRWTPRPGAHFRELAEACALLRMQPAAAADLLRSLHSQAADERGSCPALTSLQVSRLSRDQALCVLGQRASPAGELGQSATSRMAVAKAAPGEVIKAARMFTKNGRSKQVSLVTELSVGLGLGIGAGLVWKIYHWNEKRKIGEYYQTLAIINAQKEQEATGES
ncbi:hypothetical protein WJX84_003647 [Apatococcus fuscideae]|uniref:Uncharacterized protein n=1 Tax=Apatococcus fuscideae TaxID=2026836 RepID=A0AAW1SVW2_9CHLO